MKDINVVGNKMTIHCCAIINSKSFLLFTQSEFIFDSSIFSLNDVTVRLTKIFFWWIWFLKYFNFSRNVLNFSQLCSVTLFSEKMFMWFHAQLEQKILDSIYVVSCAAWTKNLRQYLFCITHLLGNKCRNYSVTTPEALVWDYLEPDGDHYK